MSLQHQLAEQVGISIQAAQAAGDLPAFDIPPIRIERPRDPSHGDYACPLALRLVNVAHMAPIKIAQAIADHFPTLDYVDTVNAVHPGFLNIKLAAVFHPTYETCRVLHPQVPQPLQLARLRFYRAAKQIFARVLDLMGMSAPEMM